MSMTKKLLCVLSACIFVLLPTYYAGATLETEIATILDDRQTAIETKDYDLYMSAIGTNNQFLYNEQERWFMNMIDASISDVSFEVESVTMLDANHGIVTIRQKHKMNMRFDFTYPLEFRYEDGHWKDYGYYFNVFETDRFLVKYTEDETKLDDFVQMLNDAFDHLDTLYALKPLDDYEMKLFTSQKMLWQRCIPANPWLFTGWSEPDESIKLYTGHDMDYASYAGVVQHELVHHITIRICNNNLPLWLLEGIAMYDGSAFYGIDASTILMGLSKEHTALTIEQLESNDLNNDLSRQEIVDFYNTSYMYVRYLIETYGRDTFMELFYEAGKKPFHDSTLNPTFEQENRNTATDVLAAVLGITKEELSSAYLQWLDGISDDEIRDIPDRRDQQPNLTAMIIIGNEFGSTYFDMKTALETLGFQVVTVGVGAKDLYSSCPNHERQRITADIDIGDITEETIDDYALVFIPAGKHFRTLQYSKDVARVLTLCKENQLYISSVCAGNIVLSSVDGLIEDHSIATSAATRDAIKQAGGNCAYSMISVDGYFVTGAQGGGKTGSSHTGAPIEELAEELLLLLTTD